MTKRRGLAFALILGVLSCAAQALAEEPSDADLADWGIRFVVTLLFPKK